MRNDLIDIILHIFWGGGMLLAFLYSYLLKKIKHNND